VSILAGIADGGDQLHAMMWVPLERVHPLGAYQMCHKERRGVLFLVVQEGKMLKNLTFLVEIFRILTQTING